MLVTIGYSEDSRNRDRVSIKYGLGVIHQKKVFSGEVDDRQKLAFARQPLVEYTFSSVWKDVVKQPSVPNNEVKDEFKSYIPFPDGWVGFNAIYVLKDKNFGIYVKERVNFLVKSDLDYPDIPTLTFREAIAVAGAISKPQYPLKKELKTSFSAYAFQDKFISPMITYRYFPIIRQYKKEPEYYRTQHFFLGIAKSLNPSSYEPRKTYSYEIKCEIGKKSVIYSIPEDTDAHIVNLIGLPFSCITKNGKQVVVRVNFTKPTLAIIKTSDDLEVKVRIVPYYSWRSEAIDKVR